MKELDLFSWGLMIGQKIKYNDGDFNITFILEGGRNEFGGLELFDSILEQFTACFCKPILRTLDQMTDEEKKELIGWDWILSEKYRFTNSGYYHTTNKIKHFHNFSIEEIDWLTQKGFDIRGFIDAGLAIKKEDGE